MKHEFTLEGAPPQGACACRFCLALPYQEPETPLPIPCHHKEGWDFCGACDEPRMLALFREEADRHRPDWHLVTECPDPSGCCQMTPRVEVPQIVPERDWTED